MKEDVLCEGGGMFVIRSVALTYLIIQVPINPYRSWLVIQYTIHCSVELINYCRILN